MPAEDSKRMWMPRWIIDEMLRDLNHSEIRVFLVYTRHANADGESFPGNPLISYKTGLSTRSVQRAVSSLVTKGLLSKVSSGTGGRRVFTRYRVLSQSWKEYQDAARDSGPAAGGPERGPNHDSHDTHKGSENADSAASEGASVPDLSTKGASVVMVCGKPETIPRQSDVRVCGKLSTKHDTAVRERQSQNEKPCHPCRKTMTPGVVNHDRAMAPEVITKKFFKGNAGRKGRNHDNGERRTATTGIEGIVKKMFRSVNSVCNSKRKADKMIQDLHWHLADKKEDAACVTVGA